MKTENYLGHTFEVAETEAEFRALYGPTSDLAKRKSLPALDVHCRDFIERSPFMCLSTAAPDGPGDVSPRGDAPGFVRVLDSKTLFVPDRLGNNRLDSLSNIVCNPFVGLLFLVPGVDETLRVNGRARVVISGEILGESTANGKRPTTGLLITIEEAFLQCAKALKRSHLWSADGRQNKLAVPTLGKMLHDQIGSELSVEQLDEAIDKAYREKLY